jgi:hypothetical protein
MKKKNKIIYPYVSVDNTTARATNFSDVCKGYFA